MKFTILLFSIIFSLLAIEIKAQPGCRYLFNPFSICGTEFQKSEFIFYGEALSYEQSLSPTAKIKVIDVFKGKLPEEIEVHFNSNQVYCGHLPVKSKYIFLVSKTKINNQKAYSVVNWSTPMTDYSKEGINDVFAEIQATLDNKPQLGLQGYVLEPSDSNSSNINQESRDRTSFSTNILRIYPNVTVEAQSEADGKTYRAVTDKDGKYVFDKLPFGKYRMAALVKGKESIPETVEITGRVCESRHYIVVKSKSEKL